MAFGRIGTSLAILAISVALASFLVRRHRARQPLSGVPPRTAVPAISAAVPKVPPKVTPQPLRATRDPAPEVLDDPLSEAVCPVGMVLVDGKTCAEGARRCAERKPGAPPSCLRYEPARCRRGLALRFCVDRFEYPNLEGMLPAAMITFGQARSACAEEGKRLCSETEWAFACEGPKGFAFSYGDEADQAACNVGHPIPRLSPDALWEPKDISAALERVDARARSGSMRRCVSPFGARDLIGNVEEWVKSDTAGFESALRGGEYSQEPTCQAVRQIKQPSFRQLHTGFRCCRDPAPLPSARPHARER